MGFWDIFRQGSAAAAAVTPMATSAGAPRQAEQVAQLVDSIINHPQLDNSEASRVLARTVDELSHAYEMAARSLSSLQARVQEQSDTISALQTKVNFLSSIVRAEQDATRCPPRTEVKL